jgi:osmotically-inducible protein OsmY
MSADANLQNAVESELKWEPILSAASIGVTAEAGVVTLTGHVESYAQKAAAETAALRVRGVRGVADDIEVRLPGHVEHDDADIAAKAVELLDWDATIPNGAVKVRVEDGFLTLTGKVEWNYQREHAARAVARLSGLVGVANEINLTPKVDATFISDDIQHALNRSWFFDPLTIEVSANDGVVTLTGTVQTPHERQLAASAAWAAPGVSDVINNLTVVPKA